MNSSLFLLLLLGLLLLPPPSLAQNGQLEDLVGTPAILGHLSEFERIANLPGNEGSRAVYLGHKQSGDYVIGKLEEAGYDVIVQEVLVPLTLYLETPVFRLLKPEITE